MKILTQQNIRNSLHFMATSILMATAFSFSIGLAQDTAKNSAEAWIAPARAARKQNPIPADACLPFRYKTNAAKVAV